MPLSPQRVVWGNRLKIALCTVLACLCLFLASSFVLGVARTWHDNTICGGKSQTACIQHRRAQRYGPFKAFGTNNHHTD